MTVYISGRITGDPDYKEKFDLMEKCLKNAAHFDVVNPTKEVPFNENWSWSDYMKQDVKLLADCDGIFMMKGWRRSKGARLERYLAKKLGLIIMYQR